MLGIYREHPITRHHRNQLAGALVLALPLLSVVEALLHDVKRPLDARDSALQLSACIVQLLARRDQPLHLYGHLGGDGT